MPELTLSKLLGSRLRLSHKNTSRPDRKPSNKWKRSLSKRPSSRLKQNPSSKPKSRRGLIWNRNCKRNQWNMPKPSKSIWRSRKLRNRFRNCNNLRLNQNKRWSNSFKLWRRNKRRFLISLAKKRRAVLKSKLNSKRKARPRSRPSPNWISKRKRRLRLSMSWRRSIWRMRSRSRH